MRSPGPSYAIFIEWVEGDWKLLVGYVAAATLALDSLGLATRDLCSFYGIDVRLRAIGNWTIPPIRQCLLTGCTLSDITENINLSNNTRKFIIHLPRLSCKQQLHKCCSYFEFQQ